MEAVNRTATELDSVMVEARGAFLDCFIYAFSHGDPGVRQAGSHLRPGPDLPAVHGVLCPPSEGLTVAQADRVNLAPLILGPARFIKSVLVTKHEATLIDKVDLFFFI